MNAFEPRSRGEHRLQIRAMNPDVWRAKALPVGVTDFMLANEPPAAPITENQMGHFGPTRREAHVVSGFVVRRSALREGGSRTQLCQPELLEETSGVGREGDGGANLA